MQPQRPHFTPIADPPANVLAHSRAQFEKGSVTLADLAKQFGMSVATLKARMAKRWGWIQPRPPRATKLTKSRKVRTPHLRLDGKVRGVLKRELARFEKELADLPPEGGDIERTTRVLASLVRTLAALARLETSPHRKGGAPVHDLNEPAPDMARIRDELVHRLGGEHLTATAPAGDRPTE